MTIAIVAFTAAGTTLIFGMLIAEIRASAKHQRWIEENNARRHGVK